MFSAISENGVTRVGGPPRISRRCAVCAVGKSISRQRKRTPSPHPTPLIAPCLSHVELLLLPEWLELAEGEARRCIGGQEECLSAASRRGSRERDRERQAGKAEAGA